MAWATYSFLNFDTSDALDTASIEALPVVECVERRAQHYRIRLDRNLGALSTLLSSLEAQRAIPIGLSTHQATLDDVFIQLTGRALAQEEVAQ